MLETRPLDRIDRSDFYGVLLRVLGTVTTPAGAEAMVVPVAKGDTSVARHVLVALIVDLVAALATDSPSVDMILLKYFELVGKRLDCLRYLLLLAN